MGVDISKMPASLKVISDEVFQEYVREAEFVEVAQIKMLSEEFSQKYGIEFAENNKYEAPGPMAYVSLLYQDTIPFGLEHYYDYEAAPGIWVHAREQDREEICVALREVIGGAFSVFP